MSTDKEFDKRLQRYERDADYALPLAEHSLSDETHLSVLIDPNGMIRFWVGRSDDSKYEFEGDRWPEHEMTGPLPNEFKVRILRARCGRMTRSGKPCRNLPSCRYHRRRQ